MNNNKLIIVSKQLSKIGGVQNVVKQLSSYLNEQQFSTSTFSFAEKDPDSTNITMISDFYQILKHHIKGFNSVIYTITGYQIIIFSIISLIFNKKIIYWEHGNPLFLNNSISYKILKKIFYRFSSAIVVTHPKFINSHLLPFIFIPNPYQVFSNINSKKINPLINKVVWVGRISEEKQPKLAFSSMIKSAENNPSVVFYYVYTPFDKFDMDLPDNFILINGCDYEPSKFLDSNTILLLTSTAEAMPGVVFEALSYGATVMTTSCTPWVHDIKNITCSVDFNPNISTSDLTEKINLAIQNGNNINQEELIKLFERISPKRVLEEWIAILSK